jgi:hypothetical protein
MNGVAARAAEVAANIVARTIATDASTLSGATAGRRR